MISHKVVGAISDNVQSIGEGGELKHYRLLNVQKYKLSASVE